MPAYYLIEEDSDTRVHETDDPEEGQFASWKEAREEAMAYLSELILDCQQTLAEFEQAKTYEEYSKLSGSTTITKE